LSWAWTINEANQNWDAAESALVAEIERYGEHPAAWYFFCRRNGCGNLALARQAAFPDGVEDFAASGAMPDNYGALALEGKPSKALAIYERQSIEKPSSWIAMQAAIAADQIGERPKRDAFLKRVVEQTSARETPNDKRPHRQELVDLARHLIDDLAKGGTCSLNFEALHSSRDTAPERDRCSFNYFLACYLDNRGQSKQAVKYWKLCMGCPDLVMTTRTAAGFELHKRGAKPAEWKKLLFTPPPMAP
jgi:hypothetical protein